MADNSEIIDLVAQLVAKLALLGMATTAADASLTMLPAAFDAKGAATYLGIGRTKLDELRKAGDVKTTVIGGRPKYLRKNLDRFIERIEKAA